MALQRTGIENRNAGNARSSDDIFDTAPNDLNLGEFRHRLVRLRE
jgi:hypothetical protein